MDKVGIPGTPYGGGGGLGTKRDWRRSLNDGGEKEHAAVNPPAGECSRQK